MPEKFKTVIEFLKENIVQGETLVVACSGGPDSMCLLDLLIRNANNVKIVVAHVHHNVRKESDDELIFVKKYVQDNNLIFESMKIEEYVGTNFENEARQKRYNFFHSIIQKYNAKYLLTAHHGDDLMETILMRLVRGSSLKGYSGFSSITKLEDYTILRPLITVTKKDIIDYNELNNVPYVTDYTNSLDIHTRNRYRKYILPKLKEENENVNLKFLKFSELLLEYDTYVEKTVENLIDTIYINDKLDLNMFKTYESIIQKRIISKILSKVYRDNITEITDIIVLNIQNQILSTKTNSILYLPCGKLCVKSYNSLYIKENKEKNPVENYEYVFNNILKLPNNKIIEQVTFEESNSNYVCRLSSNNIKLPIIVRNRKDGDMLTIMNMEGHKKLKDIFINAKISKEERDTWPIVTDSNNNILWVPGIKKTKYNKQKDEKYDIILKYY